MYDSIRKQGASFKLQLQNNLCHQNQANSCLNQQNLQLITIQRLLFKIVMTQQKLLIEQFLFQINFELINIIQEKQQQVQQLLFHKISNSENNIQEIMSRIDFIDIKNFQQQFDHLCILLNQALNELFYYRSYKYELIKEGQNQHHLEERTYEKNISKFKNKKLINTVQQLIKFNIVRIIILEVQQVSPNSSELYYKIGVSLQEIKLYDEAIQMYNKAIQMNPNQAELYFNKGKALFELRNFEESILMYDKAISIQPANAEFNYYKGFPMLEMQKYELQLFTQAMEINPNYPEAHLKKETSLQLIDDYQFAQKIQQQQKYYSYGDIYFKLGQVNQAFMMYLKATELTYQKQEISLKTSEQENPTNFQDQDSKSNNIISSSDESDVESTDVFDEYILINPICAKSLIMNGNIFFLFGANDKAMKLYDRAMIRIQNLNNKIQEKENAVTIQENTRLEAVTIFMKGRIYQSKGRSSEAEAYCKGSCQLNPTLIKYQNSDMIPALHKVFNN
ncbi:hypothetical protein pb186bvf_003397 [Paramecium bursaria]